MRIKTAITYRLLYQAQSLAIFFAFYLLFGVLFPLIGIFMANSTEVIQSDALFPSLIYMFILAFIGNNTDFKLFIQNGFSRKTIFIINLISNMILAFIYSGILCLLVKFLDQTVRPDFRLSLTLINQYTNDGFFLNWFVLFVLLMLASSLGFLAGIFNDRFTGLKKLIFLVLLLIIPVVLAMGIQLGGEVARAYFFHFIQRIIGYSTNGLAIAPLVTTLTVLVLVNSGLAYLLNHHREIKRVNA
ncbi:hypothetical protein [Candidatus Enterococcus courvalinii]|uniref:ABC transporter permease n=1 Tax=Candidatus Enterococcus courvalinii TaxID=2815329 RepID=A0ABS3I2K3_9ENTE|nr:hypothetical protein [Enterococcus sp. MSG2901]MBO0482949.1 hypothetical protein [Enterococcus sp. MSG2901]